MKNIRYYTLRLIACLLEVVAIMETISAAKGIWLPVLRDSTDGREEVDEVDEKAIGVTWRRDIQSEDYL